MLKLALCKTLYLVQWVYIRVFYHPVCSKLPVYKCCPFEGYINLLCALQSSNISRIYNQKIK